ncbi:hypothetical protein BMH32_12790 [Leucobacter sp. OLJS4]|uniref:protease inhibitor I42 family protein n=1 Tax=unclassified Leucobacter TaxID=2621730 RepID=UPI000C1827DA|nr:MULTISPECIES: protease inhibitor I42 family protein [unclassified Leucobacter]PIJ51885.1 hypothetical protein BMH30_03295 [Leucobacter sp. OLES1]PII81433.1 hypothetical protein BMH25_12870 [Leucobacter sp. OLCALW19]PII86103.1 hypothetical protein BMH26_13290 [Leucobacter sp. OLTLW20]PII89998.1 hypothetical protein BMH27_11455 [Leucobacter sp. OLAS13]PII97031.1 hypothetical protein BMH29_12140 [Leucobacter sp. OLDS2]
MRTVARSILAIGAVILFAGLSAGCAPVAREVIIGYHTHSVTVPVGEILVVEFGTINSSVGDQWEITEGPDPKVLALDERKTTRSDPKEPIGAPHEFAYRFVARAKGTTTVGFEYRFRGEIPEDPARRDSSRITITVK